MAAVGIIFFLLFSKKSVVRQPWRAQCLTDFKIVCRAPSLVHD
jgi:hypothetical protein